MIITVRDLTGADNTQMVLNLDLESDTGLNTVCQNKWLDTSCLQFCVS